MKFFSAKNKNRGMTYVEVIVVLSIFGVLSGVSLYNYRAFQEKVDIKSLANDIAIKAVEMQKKAIYGNLPPLAQQGSITSTWNPAYGLHFTRTLNNYFYRFTDLNNNTFYDGSDCGGECLEKIRLTKSNVVTGLYVFYYNGSSQSVTDLTFTFTRPSGGASISSVPPASPNISYAQIDIASPGSVFASIKVFSSGRIQIN